MTQKLDTITRVRIAQEYLADPRRSLGALARTYGVSPTAIASALASLQVPIRGREEQRALLQPRKPRTSRRPR